MNSFWDRVGFAKPTRRIALTLFALALASCTTAPSSKETPSAALDRRFTIAVIPDTQNYIDYTHQKAEGFAFDANEMFLQQMDYIAKNLKSAGGDIAFVTSVGDIWQHQSLEIDPAHAARGFKRAPNPILDQKFAPTPKVHSIEMPTAKKGFEMIAGRTPFSVVPGNHDYDAMWTDYNHPPKAQVRSAADVGMLHAGGLSNFKKVFSDKSDFFRGKDWYIASHDDGADSAQIFTAGGYRFLHIGLQFDAPNASLEWAASVIKRHPGVPTIITTHDYLDNEGRRASNPIIDHHAVDPEDNNPEMVWEKFVSQHDQIFLVLCGHHHGQSLRVDDNRFGHKVYQVLADYQDRKQSAIDAGATLSPGLGIGDGWMRLMTFDFGAAIPRVTVRTYSTHYGQDSAQTEKYAAWYKAQEKPKLSDADFLAQDDFSIDLTDFRARFQPQK